MYGRPNISMMRSFRQDPTVTHQKLKPGTVRRILTYAKPYRLWLTLFLTVTILDALITVVNPLLLRAIIDKGILARDLAIVIGIAVAVAAVAIFDAFLGFAIRWYSSRIGEGLIYDLRTEVFSHVQQQPIAFFTRAQTGSLVSRLNSDVIGAQQAITSTMSSVVSNVLTVGAILVTMFYLSWQISLIALILIPLFSSCSAVPARSPRYSPNAPGGCATSASSSRCTARCSSSRCRCWLRWPPRWSTGSAAPWPSAAPCR
jgi:ATP-binding cassette subfamily B protein